MAEKKSTTGKAKPTPPMKVKLEDLSQAHYMLIEKYINTLNQVSKLQSWIVYVSFFDEEESPKINRPSAKLVEFLMPLGNPIGALLIRTPALSYLIRLFVESHIKGKLNELSVAYLYLFQTIPKNYRAAEKYKTWLKDSIEACEKLSGTLQSLQSTKGLVSTLWPIALNVVAALLGVSNLKEAVKEVSWNRLLPSIVFIAFPLIYFGLFMTGAFWYKRKLLTGLTFFESTFPSRRPNSPDSANNVYQLEDQLFRLLDRGKVREFRWDLLSMPLSLLGLSLVGVSDWLLDPSKAIDWPVIGIILVLVIGYTILVSFRKWD